MIFSLATKEDAVTIANIHKTEISGGFLSSLSPAFLKRFYLALIESPASFCVITKENGQVVGFVAGTTNLNAFYQYFLSHYFFQSFFILLPNIFFPPQRDPAKAVTSFKKIIETLLYPSKEQSLPKAELLTIAIIKEFQGKGVGGLLLEPFIVEMKKRNVDAFKVVVGESLPQAIAFYEKNGFTFVKNVNIHSNAISRVYVYKILN